MNDRYLYRAKRTDSGEWITGYLLVNKKDFYICENPYECMDEYSSLNGQSYGFGGFKFVDPSTIYQCTGLKDKNGKLIWENDIVKVHDDEEPCLIEWGEDTARWNMTQYGSCVYDFDNYWSYEVEVIGSVIDNPELLEVGE